MMKKFISSLTAITMVMLSLFSCQKFEDEKIDLSTHDPLVIEFGSENDAGSTKAGSLGYEPNAGGSAALYVNGVLHCSGYYEGSTKRVVIPAENLPGSNATVYAVANVSNVATFPWPQSESGLSDLMVTVNPQSSTPAMSTTETYTWVVQTNYLKVSLIAMVVRIRINSPSKNSNMTVTVNCASQAHPFFYENDASTGNMEYNATAFINDELGIPVTSEGTSTISYALPKRTSGDGFDITTTWENEFTAVIRDNYINGNPGEQDDKIIDTRRIYFSNSAQPTYYLPEFNASSITNIGSSSFYVHVYAENGDTDWTGKIWWEDSYSRYSTISIDELQTSKDIYGSGEIPLEAGNTYEIEINTGEPYSYVFRVMGSVDEDVDGYNARANCQFKDIDISPNKTTVAIIKNVTSTFDVILSRDCKETSVAFENPYHAADYGVSVYKTSSSSGKHTYAVTTTHDPHWTASSSPQYVDIPLIVSAPEAEDKYITIRVNDSPLMVTFDFDDGYGTATIDNEVDWPSGSTLNTKVWFDIWGSNVYRFYSFFTNQFGVNIVKNSVTSSNGITGNNTLSPGQSAYDMHTTAGLSSALSGTWFQTTTNWDALSTSSTRYTYIQGIKFYINYNVKINGTYTDIPARANISSARATNHGVTQSYVDPLWFSAWETINEKGPFWVAGEFISINTAVSTSVYTSGSYTYGRYNGANGYNEFIYTSIVNGWPSSIQNASDTYTADFNPVTSYTNF